MEHFFMDTYFDLGAHNRPITTNSPDAQRWFDRGLNWCYGFNFEEAVYCFEKAEEADPHCPMARWGIAYASGPNYNQSWEKIGWERVQRDAARCHVATEIRRSVFVFSCQIFAILRAQSARLCLHAAAFTRTQRGTQHLDGCQQHDHDYQPFQRIQR